MNNPTMSQALLREMFDRMVVAKDAALVPVYYHPDLLLTTNGQVQDYAAFASGHQKVYGTAISYAVTYDDEAWVESPTGWRAGCGSPPSARTSRRPE